MQMFFRSFLLCIYSRTPNTKTRIVQDAYSQIEHVDQVASNVIGANGTFRTIPETVHYNPSKRTPPFFQVLHDDFLNIIGSNPTLTVISSDPSFAFAHEAPVWVLDRERNTNDIFFASNAGGLLGRSGIDQNNQVSRISMKVVDEAMRLAGRGKDVNVTYDKIDLPESVQMTNGGTGLYEGKIILMNEGRGHRPSNMVFMDPYPPYNVIVALDNFYGRQFNSLNDVKVFERDTIYFTDVPYGYYQHFKPEPQLPSQVYSFNPRTGAVRVVADGLNKPNGIAFSANYERAYVTDTGVLLGSGTDRTLPATIYQYDMDIISNSFINKRVFAYADSAAQMVSMWINMGMCMLAAPTVFTYGTPPVSSSESSSSANNLPILSSRIRAVW
ncbi:hypothetical protein D9757_012924 [Collybiopsis confluens]|uniref:SMP-30/Gluconolactonase/LRE-like region domain-containing protein n=1 Tax=Collybiopsis confluens TaxID=2823264 RepID=A0A8H5LR29_9AGAR|nr:hypothetical protein D9757_012924 [Collybiopsis confluens]